MTENEDLDNLVEHIAECVKPAATLVMQSGSADGMIAELVEQGWTLNEGEEYVGGKRIRYMTPPPEVAEMLRRERP